MSTYINPYTDFGFKKLFGEEASKDLLIDFLNAILPAHHQIAELSFQNAENLPDTSNERKALFALHCQSANGEQFIVEIQKADMKHFKDRLIYYISFPIRDQAQREDRGFKPKDIYFISILDFFYETDKDNATFYRCIGLKDQYNNVFYNNLQMYCLQMPAFKKSDRELESHFDKWAFFLKNLESFDSIPQILKEPIFEQAFDTAMLANLDREQMQEYERSRLSYIGIREAIKTAE
jgi:predicted transposase/invertase (TIGR01784 family)